MLAFDASSMIHAWDNYPPEQFPSLWEWMASQMMDGEFVMAQVAFEEVQKKTPDCAKLLKKWSITRIRIDNDIVQESSRIKKLLGITDDDYHSKGVSENDILIIAAAKIRELELVSDEGQQTRPPRENRKLKIPGVCNLPDVGVPCMSFIELIRRSGEIFG
jgi:hypothetical protein